MAERKLDTQSVMLEINQNLSRNFMSMDEKSWKVWENTFADELMIDFGGVKQPQKTTPKNLMDWAKKAYATVKTQHMLFNMDIRLDGDQRHQNLMVMPHERTDSGDFFYAIYEHEHVRTPNRWRISKIKMSPNFQEGNPRLLDESFALATKS